MVWPIASQLPLAASAGDPRLLMRSTHRNLLVEESMSAQTHEGGCQCGAIRYRLTGDPAMTAICHCVTCRRANAAPAVAWAMFPEPQVTFVQGSPSSYESSAGVRRGFCERCGTQISFTADYIPGLIDITIGSLDRPEAFAPSLHYWDSKRLPWMEFADGLPRYPEFPPSE